MRREILKLVNLSIYLFINTLYPRFKFVQAFLSYCIYSYKQSYFCQSREYIPGSRSIIINYILLKILYKISDTYFNILKIQGSKIFIPCVSIPH